MTGSQRTPDDLLADVQALAEQREWEAATQLCQSAIAQGADVLMALCHMAAIAYQVGDYSNAIQILERCQSLPNTSTDIPEILAVLNAETGRLAEAVFYGKLATVRPLDNRILPLFGPTLPSFAEVFFNMQQEPLISRAGEAFEEGKVASAKALYRQQVDLEPDNQAALTGLVRCLLEEGSARAATDLLRALRARAPVEPRYASLMGAALTASGRFAEGMACHRQAAALTDNGPEAALAALRDLVYDPGHAPEQIMEWWSLLGTSTATGNRSVDDPDGRPLVVGYLCGGLSVPEAHAMTRIWRHHDRSRIHVIGYGYGTLSHRANFVYRNVVDGWQDLSDLDLMTIAAVIGGDAVDVLVDVSGLKDATMVAVLAQRPAPIQVSWAAESTLPLPAVAGIDHRLGGADPVMDGLPPRWPLPLPIWATEMTILPTAVRPAGEFPVFGADARLAQLNADVVLCWSMILLAEPTARLHLYDRDLSDEDNAPRLREMFGNFGVSQRVEVVAADSVRQFFANVDVALAPFPVAGRTSVFGAFAVGVPAVILAPPQWPARELGMAVSQMDLGEALVAESHGDYIAKAVALARNAALRRDLSAVLPERLAASPVLDAAALATALDEAYWEMARLSVSA